MNVSRSALRPRSQRLVLPLIVVLLACLACAGGEADPGPKGQRLIDIGDGATLTVPAGAFDDDVKISAKISGDAPRTPQDRAGLSSPIDVSAEP